MKRVLVVLLLLIVSVGCDTVRGDDSTVTQPSNFIFTETQLDEPTETPVETVALTTFASQQVETPAPTPSLGWFAERFCGGEIDEQEMLQEASVFGYSKIETLVEKDVVCHRGD